MKSETIELTYEIELQPGEKVFLPDALTQQVGAGRWLITFRPIEATPIRNHRAFLNSYAPEDEGLYDDYPAR